MTTATSINNKNKHRTKPSSWLRRRKAAALATIQWRRNNPSPSSQSSLLGPHPISRKNERRATTIAFALIVLTTLLITDEDFQSIVRRLCVVPRPYVTVAQALTLPQHPNVGDVNDASHIELCREYIRRSALSPEEQSNEDMFYLQEDMNVCYDWSNPHAALMELFASSLVGKVGSELGLVYNHDCRRALPDHAVSDKGRSDISMNGKWDSTSVQQLLASVLISNTDVEKLDGDTISNLCRGCIAETEARTDSGKAPLNPHSTHQCLLFPGSGSTENSRVALASVLPSITKRLRHMSVDWIEKSGPLPYEDEEGVIVFLDETSILMHYSVYDKNIPSTATKLQILATASCAHASVTENNNCIEHGRRVKRFIMLNRPEIYVRYDVVASTAASYARMIAVKTLICPPGTHSCLLPALAKNKGTDAIIAEAASSHATFSWFGHVMDAKQEQAESDGDGGSNLDVLTLQEEELEMSLAEIGERERAVVNPIEDNEVPAKQINGMPTDGETFMRDENGQEAKVTAPEDYYSDYEGGQSGPALVQEGEFPMVGYNGRTDVVDNTPALTTEGNLVISGGDMRTGQSFQMSTETEGNVEGNLRGRAYSNNVEGEWTAEPEQGDNIEGEWTEEPQLISAQWIEGEQEQEGERPASPQEQETGAPVPIDEPYGGPMNQEDLWNRNRQRREAEKARKVEKRQAQRRDERIANRRNGMESP